MAMHLPHDQPTLAMLHDALKRYQAGRGPEYVRPKDIGGTATNARSQSLQRLVALGLAERQPREVTHALTPMRWTRQVMRSRVSYEYRITAAGEAIVDKASP